MQKTIGRANALFSKDRRVYAIHGKGAEGSGVRGVGIRVEWAGIGVERVELAGARLANLLNTELK
jgi:hypothetical protein